MTGSTPRLGVMLNILLVDGALRFVTLVHESLARGLGGHVSLTHVRLVTEALEYLTHGPQDVALMSLPPTEDGSLQDIRQVHQLAPDLPIVILGTVDDKEAEMRSLREGAQDYLTEKDFARDELIRSIHHAIERQKSQSALHSLALIDDLTGVYNRRGFASLATHHLKLSRRHAKPFTLFFADLDGLKLINDTWGHLEGSQAIADMAAILRASFRGSDILARLGGDEFCALMMDADARSAQLVQARIDRSLAAYNAQPGRLFTLSLSTGLLSCEPGDARSLQELLGEVDRRMYEAKRARVTPPA